MIDYQINRKLINNNGEIINREKKIINLHAQKKGFCPSFLLIV